MSNNDMEAAYNACRVYDHIDIISSETSPSLTIIKETYGYDALSTYLCFYVLDIAVFSGLIKLERNTDRTLQARQYSSIADSIIAYRPDLKASEIALCFQLAKAGRWRDKEGRNLLTFFGTFSGQPILDCISAYVSYRNDLLEQERRREMQLRQESERANAVTIDEMRDSIAAQCFASLSLEPALNNELIITHQYMQDLQYYVEERKVLLLLKQRVEEVLNADPDNPLLEKLKKGVEHINAKFPDANGNNAQSKSA